MLSIRALSLCLVGVTLAASASVKITQPQQGSTVECGDKSIWLELEVEGLELGPGKGSANVFVNGEYFVTLRELTGGLQHVDEGPAAIEVKILDAEEQEVGSTQVQVNAVLSEEEKASAAAPKTHSGPSARDYIPPEGTTALQGIFTLMDPKPGSRTPSGKEVTIRWRLDQAMNPHMSVVRAVVNNAQEIYAWQGESAQQMFYPGFPDGQFKMKLKLEGPEPAPWKNLEVEADFTVGGPDEDDDAKAAAMLAQTHEGPAFGEEVVVIAVDSAEEIAMGARMIGSMKDSGVEATVVVICPDSLYQSAQDTLNTAWIVSYKNDLTPHECRGEIGSGAQCAKFWVLRAFMLAKIVEMDAARIFLTEPDTLFQSNVFQEVEDTGTLQVFGISRDLHLEDDDDFSHYLTDQCLLYDGSLLNEHGEKPASWAGVALAPFSMLLPYLEIITKEMASSLVTRMRKFADVPPRQTLNSCHYHGVHNALLYTEKIDDAIASQTEIFDSESSAVLVAHRWPALETKDAKILLPGQDTPAAVVVGSSSFAPGAANRLERKSQE